MSSEAAPKLTKKQQKALAHRSGGRKGKGKEEPEQADVPELDLADGEAGLLEKPKAKKARDAATTNATAGSKKRKRDGGENEDETKSATTTTTKKRKPKATKDRKQRFIVFVGE